LAASGATAADCAISSSIGRIAPAIASAALPLLIAFPVRTGDGIGLGC
jgi:hypothetical protein